MSRRGRTSDVGNKHVSKPKGLSLRQGTRDLLAILAEEFPDYNPVKAMAEIANHPGVPLEIKAHMHKEIAGYLYAKRKAIDVDARVKQDVEFRMIMPGALPAMLEGDVVDEQ